MFSNFNVANILTNAETLKSSTIQKKSFALHIKQILRAIQAEIQTAQRSGQHDIWYAMPSVFDIPYTKNIDAQRIIWGNVMDMLIQKGYEVGWKNIDEDDRIILYIKWITDEDEQIRKVQEDLLQKLKIN